jgi:hypothetical protein
MNSMLVAAAIVLVIVGIVHSVLGEVLIFRLMRERRIIPTNGRPILKERHVRILWATWHLPSILAVMSSTMLWKLAELSELNPMNLFVKNSICVAMVLSSLMVLVATKARHPGWIGLGLVAVLIAIS